ncbi:MAG TPA: trypsin-like peptidase domain-containing protein, partial [Anaerolineales bacterium]|nr:trypsin-like peptidase domain-containing protein [Anaerolineales bacterium]
MKTYHSLAVLLVLALAALACRIGGGLPQTSAPQLISPSSGVPPISVVAPNNPLAAQDSFIALYQQSSRGVVIIKVIGPDGEALGAGFVYDPSGNVVTNYHVVENAVNDKVEVDFLSGYKAYGTVIGTDLDSDLAVVKVDAPAAELHPLTLGDSDALQVGQTVIAIGNPFQYFGSMSVGIVSAVHRTLDSQHLAADNGRPFTAGDLIQTDTAINPGNSGGPLFNMSGEVVGVNRAIETTNFTANGQPLNSGVGFAVSSNIIRRVVPVIIRDGKYDYPYLGISSYSLGNPSRGGMSLDEIEALGLGRYTGTYITGVAKGGPADQAGILAGTKPTSFSGLNAGGDVIIAI